MTTTDKAPSAPTDGLDKGRWGMRRRRARRVGVTLLLIAGLVAVFQLPALAGTGDTDPGGLRFIQALLVALGYWWTQSAFTANLGFTMFRWPIVAGMFVGIIMGDVGQGVLLGASINLVFLGVISAGGATPADPALAGWLGTALAMSAGLGPPEAIAIAAPLGVLGLLGFFSRMSVNVAFVRGVDRKAEEGDIRGVRFFNLWAPQGYLFLITFFPVLVLALVGSTALNALFDAIDPFRGGSADWQWIRDWFIIAGTVLPAVGISINLNLILGMPTIPYFIVFFIVSALTGVNIFAIAIVAAALAVFHVMFVTGRSENVSTP